MFGQAWWHTPVIPALWEAEAGECLNLEVEVAMSRDLTSDHLRPGVRDQPGQRGETLSLKIQKLAKYGAVCL